MRNKHLANRHLIEPHIYNPPIDNHLLINTGTGFFCLIIKDLTDTVIYHLFSKNQTSQQKPDLTDKTMDTKARSDGIRP